MYILSRMGNATSCSYKHCLKYAMRGSWSHNIPYLSTERSRLLHFLLYSFFFTKVRATLEIALVSSSIHLLNKLTSCFLLISSYASLPVISPSVSYRSILILFIRANKPCFKSILILLPCIFDYKAIAKFDNFCEPTAESFIADYSMNSLISEKFLT